MNHYPHHLGDYAKDTVGLTQGEHGAYRLLIDAAYATESGIPADEVYPVSKAASAIERKNTDKVLRKFFTLRDGRYHQKRIDEEIAVYRDKSAKASSSAKRRWTTCGQPDADHMRPDMRTHMPTHSEGNANADAKAMLASNQEPESKYRFPGDSYITDPPSKAVLEEKQGNTETVARIVAECVRGKLENPTESNPIIARWVRSGATPTQVTNAIVEAFRSSKAPTPMTAAYVDPCLERLVEADRKARANAESRHTGTQAQISEQKTWAASPMPENLKPRKAASA